MSDLITVNMAAKQLAVSKKRVYQMISEGWLDSLRLSPRAIRVTRASMERLVNERMKQEKRDLGLDLGSLPSVRRKVQKSGN